MNFKKEIQMKRLLLSVMLLVGLSVVSFGSNVTYDKNLTSGQVSIDTDYTMQVMQNGADYLSFQAIYSTAQPATTWFTDGRKSTGTITISDNVNVAGSTLTIQGIQYSEPIDWTVGAKSSNTAISLYNAISASVGAYATGYFIINSTVNISKSSFTIAGIYFVEGTDWYATKSTSDTAKSIYTKLASYWDGLIFFSLKDTTSVIYSSACVYGKSGNYVFKSFTSSITVTGMTGGRPKPPTGISFERTGTSAIIFATSTAVNISGNYKFTSSTPTALIVDGLSGGKSSDIDYTLDKINIANSYPTGLSLLFRVVSGAAPTGLTAETTYYAIAGDGTYLQVATTKANAVLGTPVDLVYVTALSSFTFIPAPMSTQYAFKWFGSDDGTNFYDLSLTSVTITATTSASNTLWDFGKINYEYLKCSVKAGAYGAINLILKGFGRSVAP